MYPIFRDIRTRLGEPRWHDRYGVPRYDEFHPSLLGIYDDWAALFVVECQACGRRFDCASGFAFTGEYINAAFKGGESLDFARRDDPVYVLERTIYWGDAPWHDDGGQCAGTTMSTEVVAIKQVWKKDREAKYDWVQVEIPLEMANRLLGFTEAS